VIALLLACAVDGGEDACVDTIPLDLQASTNTLDFGYVPLGERERRSFTLTNVGPRRMRIDSLGIGDGDQAGFDLRIDDTACVRTEQFGEGERGDTADTGAPPCTEDCYTVREVRYLDPDCPLELTVTYAPVIAGKVENAVVIQHDGDWLDDQEVIWLSGRTDGVYDGPGYIVGRVILAEESALNERRGTHVSVRLVGDVVINWTVGDGGGRFDDSTVPDPFYLAPELRECSPEWVGDYDSLYAVTSDRNADQDWAYRRLAIFSARTPLHGCPYPAPPCPEDDDGGCGGGSALLLVLALWRRPTPRAG
jgi:hypothetical protein